MRSLILFALIWFYSVDASLQSIDTATKDSLIEQAWIYFEKSDAVIEESMDSCIYYTQLAADCFRQAEDWNWHAIMLGAIGNAYYLDGADTKARDYYEQALEICRERLPNIPYFILNGYAIVFCKSRGQYDQAINLFYEALELLDKNGGSEKQRASLLENIGFALLQKGDLIKGEDYLLQALKLKQKNLGSEHIGTIKNANKLASCYRQAERIPEAIALLRNNLHYLEDRLSSGDYSDNRRIEVYTQLGDLYLMQSQADSCRYFINKALSLQVDDESLEKNFSYRVLGELALQEAESGKAIQHFSEVVRLSQLEHDAFPFHVNISEGYRHLAQAYGRIGEEEQALHYFNLSLLALCPTQPEVSLSNNPAPELFVESDAGLQVLWAKARYLYTISNNRARPAYAKSALATYQAAVATIRTVRQDYASEKAKLLLGNQITTLFEEAIELCWQLYQDTGSQQYLTDLYALVEGNRANLLLENIQSYSLQQTGVLPDSVLRQENFLKNEIAYYARKIQEAAIIQKSPSATVEDWKTQLAKLEQQYDALQRRIAHDHPVFHDLKYDYQQVTVPELQQQLQRKNTVLLQYFIGESFSCVALITKTQLHVFPLQYFSTSLAQIEALQTIITTAPNSQRYATDWQLFAQLGQELYQLLLAQALAEPPLPIEELIIIPDGQLHFLPFEILLSDAPKEQVDFSVKTFDYLLEKYTISYAYSGTLLHHNNRSKNIPNKKIWAGFAPSFGKKGLDSNRSCREDDLYDLLCNQEEVSNIQNLIADGDIFLATSARRQTFEEVANNYQILHLATHACVDLTSDTPSRIFFADDYLAGNELSLIPMNAEMAILSACNTGSGVLVKGEGVLSLARNFTMAGVSSTITSLWPVADCTTSDLMEVFYQHLTAGESKAMALKLAKLSVLKAENKLYQHPYFWAAFLQYGKPGPIESWDRMNPVWVWVAAGVLLSLLLIYYRKKSVLPHN